jgi:hypothetical protein
VLTTIEAFGSRTARSWRTNIDAAMAVATLASVRARHEHALATGYERAAHGSLMTTSTA